MNSDLIGKLKDITSISIMDNISDDKLLPVTNALINGGINLIMFNYNSFSNDKKICDNIKLLKEHFGNKIIIGAGNVTKQSQIVDVKNASGQFVLLSGKDYALVKLAKKSGLISVSSAVSIDDIIDALKNDTDFVKIFPINAFYDGFKNITLLYFEDELNENNLSTTQVYNSLKKINLDIINMNIAYWKTA